MQNLQNVNQIDPIILSIERTQKALYFFTGINVLLILVFAEIGCLYLSVCHTSADIDIAPYASHIFLPLLLITLLLSITTYEASEFILINYIGPLRIILLIYSLFMCGVTITEFIVGMQLASTSRDSAWEKLTPLGKKYYDDDSSNLDTAYRNNMVIVLVFQIITGVILLICDFFVWVLYSKTPTGYLPRPKAESVYKRFKKEKPAENMPGDNQRLENRAEQPLEPPRDYYREPLGGPGEEIKEDIDDHPLAPENPFLRRHY